MSPVASLHVLVQSYYSQYIHDNITLLISSSIDCSNLDPCYHSVVEIVVYISEHYYCSDGYYLAWCLVKVYQNSQNQMNGVVHQYLTSWERAQVLGTAQKTTTALLSEHSHNLRVSLDGAISINGDPYK